MKDLLDLGWKMLLLRGVIAIVFGLVAVAFPVTTALSLAVVWGIWAIADGIGLVIRLFEPAPGGLKVLYGLMAVISVVAGLVAVFRPGLSAAALVWVLGIWLIVRGVFELVGAFGSNLPSPRWLLIIGALLDFVLGILFVSRPASGAVSIAWVLGVFALAWGVVFLVLAWQTRKAAQNVPAGPAFPAAAV